MTTPVGAKPTETPTAGKADEKAPTADIQPGKNLSESDRHASDKAGRSDKSGTSRSERSEIPVSSKIRHADKPATSEGKKPDRRDSLTSKQPSKGDSLNTGRSRESGSSKSTRSRDARERPGGSRDTKERTTQERRESGHGRDKSGRRSSERSSGRSSRKREDRKKEESSSSHHRSRSREEQSQGQRPGSSRETTSAADARWRPKPRRRGIKSQQRRAQRRRALLLARSRAQGQGQDGGRGVSGASDISDGDLDVKGVEGWSDISCNEWSPSDDSDLSLDYEEPYEEWHRRGRLGVDRAHPRDDWDRDMRGSERHHLDALAVLEVAQNILEHSQRRPHSPHPRRRSQSPHWEHRSHHRGHSRSLSPPPRHHRGHSRSLSPPPRHVHPRDRLSWERSPLRGISLERSPDYIPVDSHERFPHHRRSPPAMRHHPRSPPPIDLYEAERRVSHLRSPSPKLHYRDRSPRLRDDDYDRRESVSHVVERIPRDLDRGRQDEMELDAYARGPSPALVQEDRIGMHIKQERLRQEWMEQQGSHIQPGHVEHTPYDRRSPGGDYETRGVRERRHQSPEYVAHERSPRGLNEFGLRYGVSPPAARPLPYGASHLGGPLTTDQVLDTPFDPYNPHGPDPLRQQQQPQRPLRQFESTAGGRESALQVFDYSHLMSSEGTTNTSQLSPGMVKVEPSQMGLMDINTNTSPVLGHALFPSVSAPITLVSETAEKPVTETARPATAEEYIPKLPSPVFIKTCPIYTDPNYDPSKSPLYAENEDASEDLSTPAEQPASLKLVPYRAEHLPADQPVKLVPYGLEETREIKDKNKVSQRTRSYSTSSSHSGSPAHSLDHKRKRYSRSKSPSGNKKYLGDSRRWSRSRSHSKEKRLANRRRSRSQSSSLSRRRYRSRSQSYSRRSRSRSQSKRQPTSKSPSRRLRRSRSRSPSRSRRRSKSPPQSHSKQSRSPSRSCGRQSGRSSIQNRRSRSHSPRRLSPARRDRNISKEQLLNSYAIKDVKKSSADGKQNSVARKGPPQVLSLSNLGRRNDNSKKGTDTIKEAPSSILPLSRRNRSTSSGGDSGTRERGRSSALVSDTRHEIEEIPLPADPGKTTSKALSCMTQEKKEVKPICFSVSLSKKGKEVQKKRQANKTAVDDPGKNAAGHALPSTTQIQDRQDLLDVSLVEKRLQEEKLYQHAASLPADDKTTENVGAQKAKNEITLYNQLYESLLNEKPKPIEKPIVAEKHIIKSARKLESKFVKSSENLEVKGKNKAESNAKVTSTSRRVPRKQTVTHSDEEDVEQKLGRNMLNGKEDMKEKQGRDILNFASGMMCPVQGCKSREFFSSKEAFDNHWRKFHWSKLHYYSCRLCQETDHATEPCEPWRLVGHFHNEHPLIKLTALDEAIIEKMLIRTPQFNPNFIDPSPWVYRCDRQALSLNEPAEPLPAWSIKDESFQREPVHNLFNPQMANVHDWQYGNSGVDNSFSSMIPYPGFSTSRDETISSTSSTTIEPMMQSDVAVKETTSETPSVAKVSHGSQKRRSEDATRPKKSAPKGKGRKIEQLRDEKRRKCDDDHKEVFIKLSSTLKDKSVKVEKLKSVKREKQLDMPDKSEKKMSVSITPKGNLQKSSATESIVAAAPWMKTTPDDSIISSAPVKAKNTFSSSPVSVATSTGIRPLMSINIQLPVNSRNLDAAQPPAAPGLLGIAPGIESKTENIQGSIHEGRQHMPPASDIRALSPPGRLSAISDASSLSNPPVPPKPGLLGFTPGAEEIPATSDKHSVLDWQTQKCLLPTPGTEGQPCNPQMQSAAILHATRNVLSTSHAHPSNLPLLLPSGTQVPASGHALNPLMIHQPQHVVYPRAPVPNPTDQILRTGLQPLIQTASIQTQIQTQILVGPHFSTHSAPAVTCQQHLSTSAPLPALQQTGPSYAMVPDAVDEATPDTHNFIKERNPINVKTKKVVKLRCPEEKCPLSFDDITQFKNHWLLSHQSKDRGVCLHCMEKGTLVSILAKKSNLIRHFNKVHGTLIFPDKLQNFLLLCDAETIRKEMDKQSQVLQDTAKVSKTRHAKMVSFSSPTSCPVEGCNSPVWENEQSFADHWTKYHISSSCGPCVRCLHQGKFVHFSELTKQAATILPSTVRSHYLLQHSEINLRKRSVFELLLCKKSGNELASFLNPEPYFYSSENTGNEESRSTIMSFASNKDIRIVNFKPKMSCPVVLCSKREYQDEFEFAKHWTETHLHTLFGFCVLCALKQEKTKFKVNRGKEIITHYQLKHSEVNTDGVDVQSLLYCKRNPFHHHNVVPFHDPVSLVYSSENTGDVLAWKWLKSLTSETQVPLERHSQKAETQRMDIIEKNAEESTVASADEEMLSEVRIFNTKSVSGTDLSHVQKDTGGKPSIIQINFQENMACPVQGCPVRGRFFVEAAFAKHWTDYHMRPQRGPCTLCVKQGKRFIVSTVKGQGLKSHYERNHPEFDTSSVHTPEALVVCKSMKSSDTKFINPGCSFYLTKKTGGRPANQLLQKLSSVEQQDESNTITKELPTEAFQPDLSDPAPSRSCPIVSCGVSGMHSEQDVQAHLVFQHSKEVPQYVCLQCEKSGNPRINPTRQLPWSMWEHLRWAHHISPKAMEKAKQGVFPESLVEVRYILNFSYKPKEAGLHNPVGSDAMKQQPSSIRHLPSAHEIPVELARKLFCPVESCKFIARTDCSQNLQHWHSQHASDCVHYICCVCGFVEGKFMAPKFHVDSLSVMMEHFQELHPWIDPTTLTEKHLNMTYVIAEWLPNITLLKKGVEVVCIHKSDPSKSFVKDKKHVSSSRKIGVCPVTNCPNCPHQRFEFRHEVQSHWKEIHTMSIRNDMFCFECEKKGVVYCTKHVWEMRRHLVLVHSVHYEKLSHAWRNMVEVASVPNSRYIDPGNVKESPYVGDFRRLQGKPVKDGLLCFWPGICCAVENCGVKFSDEESFKEHWVSEHCPRVESCICNICLDDTQLMSKGQVFSPVAIISHYLGTHPTASWLYEDSVCVEPSSVTVVWQHPPTNVCSLLRIRGLPCCETVPGSQDHITFPLNHGERAKIGKQLETVTEASSLPETPLKADQTGHQHLEQKTAENEMPDCVKDSSANTQNKKSDQSPKNDTITDSTPMTKPGGLFPTLKDPSKYKPGGLFPTQKDPSKYMQPVSGEPPAATAAVKNQKKISGNNSSAAVGSGKKDLASDISENPSRDSKNHSRKFIHFGLDAYTTCPVPMCSSPKVTQKHWSLYHMKHRGYQCLLCHGKAAEAVHSTWMLRSHLRIAHPALRSLTEKHFIQDDVIREVFIPGVHFIDPGPYTLRMSKHTRLNECLAIHDDLHDFKSAARTDRVPWLLGEITTLLPHLGKKDNCEKQRYCPAPKCKFLAPFENNLLMDQHWEFRHTPVLDKFTCTKCCMSFIGQASQLRHVDRYHLNQTKKEIQSEVVSERVPTPYYIHPGNVQLTRIKQKFPVIRRQTQEKKESSVSSDRVEVVYSPNMLCPVPDCPEKGTFGKVAEFDFHWLMHHHPPSTEYICLLCGESWQGLYGESHFSMVHPEIHRKWLSEKGGLQSLVFVVVCPDDVKNGPYMYRLSCGLSLENPPTVSIDFSNSHVDLSDPSSKVTFDSDTITLYFVENMVCPVPGCLSVEPFTCRRMFDEHWLLNHTPTRTMYRCDYCGINEEGQPMAVFGALSELTRHTTEQHEGKEASSKDVIVPELFYVDPWCYTYKPALASLKASTEKKIEMLSRCSEEHRSKEGADEPNKKFPKSVGPQRYDQQESKSSVVEEAAKLESRQTDSVPSLLSLQMLPPPYMPQEASMFPHGPRMPGCGPGDWMGPPEGIANRGMVPWDHASVGFASSSRGPPEHMYPGGGNNWGHGMGWNQGVGKTKRKRGGKKSKKGQPYKRARRE